MKKLIISILLVFGSFEVVYAATYQPRSLGWVTLSVASGTLTEIDNSTAPTVGYLRFCTNCVASGGSGTVVVSTQSTGFHGFVLSTGTIIK